MEEVRQFSVNKMGYREEAGGKGKERLKKDEGGIRTGGRPAGKTERGLWLGMKSDAHWELSDQVIL